MALHKEEFPWRVMPGDKAREAGWLDRGFTFKKQALAYQGRVKEAFPEEACSLIRFAPFYDEHGRPWWSRAEYEREHPPCLLARAVA
jgi:hypothetical protein